MFDGFSIQDIDTGEVRIRTRLGGDGPPVLLLHGYPQTHAEWDYVATRLAEDHTVVATDLRGYGDSDKPASDPAHETYSFRKMGADQVTVMASLGFDRFDLVGHDRGGRVSHRLALDHPDQVNSVTVMDIIPTRTFYNTVDKRVATGYYHWFFLIQPFDFPERLLGADPETYIRERCEKYSTPEAVEDYVRCFSDPACIHATCEDYRAAAGIDLEHDEADIDRMVECPLLVLWGGRGLMGKAYDVIETWRERARDVRGMELDCGHYLPEEKPVETYGAVAQFLKDVGLR